MLIKVCGIADPEFLRRVGELPVDFTGFIFYPESKRYVAGRLTAAQIRMLPAHHLKKTGVFVNETIENIRAAKEEYGLDIIQLHGDEDDIFTEQLAREVTVIKAFRVDEEFDFSKTNAYEKSCSFFLFDTKGKLYGGTGKKFNWELLQNYTGRTPFLLSGGITPEDAGNIHQFRHPAFAGIDINSGFEQSPGIKDIQRIKKFLNQIL